MTETLAIGDKIKIGVRGRAVWTVWTVYPDGTLRVRREKPESAVYSGRSYRGFGPSLHYWKDVDPRFEFVLVVEKKEVAR